MPDDVSVTYSKSSPWGPFRLSVVGLLLVCLGVNSAYSQSPSRGPQAKGTWRIVEAESSPIDPWNALVVTLKATSSRLTLIRRWHGPTDYTAVDSLRIPIDGRFHATPFSEWPDNRHIGAFADSSRVRRVSAAWLDDGRTLRVTSRFWLKVSQGSRRIRTYTEYRFVPVDDRLIVLELRSTRPRARRYVLTRVESAAPHDR